MRGRARALTTALAVSFALTGCSVLSETPSSGEEAPAWREDAPTLPAFPTDANLLEVDVGRPQDPYHYLIDTASLSVGRDGVTRYTIILVSGDGARNVRYEGIRCQGNAVRAYAYGTSGGILRPMPTEEWAPLRQDGPYAYRYHLARGYLCTVRSLPFDRAAALNRLRMSSPPGLSGAEGYH